MAAALLAISDDELTAGTSDERLNRLLLLVRDGFQDMKDQLKAANLEIKRLSDENTKLKTDLKNLKNKQANEQVLSEYHSKKYNMIIHNLPEQREGQVWESNIESIEKVKAFFKDDLGVENAKDMQFMNAHRFGSPKAIKDPATDRTLHTRPLIVRFTSMPDKEKVQGHLSALSNYNREITCKFHRVFIFLLFFLPTCKRGSCQYPVSKFSFIYTFSHILFCSVYCLVTVGHP